MGPHLMHASLLEDCQYGMGQPRCVWPNMTQSSQPQVLEETLHSWHTSSEVTEVAVDMANSKHISVTDPNHPIGGR